MIRHASPYLATFVYMAANVCSSSKKCAACVCAKNGVAFAIRHSLDDNVAQFR